MLSPFKRSTGLMLWLLAMLFIILTVFIPRPAGFQFSGTSRPYYGITSYDSVPGYLYRKIMDSIERVEQCQNREQMNSGKWFRQSLWGVSKVSEKKDCAGDPMGDSSTAKYFLTLGGYRLADNYRFMVQDGRYYLEDFRDVMPTPRSWQPVDVRFHENPGGDPLSGGSVFIPLSRSGYRAWLITSYITTGLVALIGVIVLFIIPLRILFSISRGKPFSRRNVTHLNLMGWTCLLLYLLPILSALGFHLIYRGLIPERINLSWPDILLAYREFFVAGLVIFLIATAFRRGLELQTENDLSV